MSATTQDDWEQHWKEYSKTAEQNPAQEYRRALIFSLLGRTDAGDGMRLLDVGSGQGDMAAALHARFPKAQILGVELSRTGVEISRRKVPEARFVQRDLLESVEPPDDLRGWATHAVCSEVIEHVDHPAQLLRNVRPFMSSGCRLVITAPGGPMSAFDKHIGHRKHWRSSEIESLLREAGYESERASGAGFPFFNLYRCLVILRGRKLIQDVAEGPAGSGAQSARIAMTVFRGLIRLNLNSMQWGWQMIATARAADSS